MPPFTYHGPFAHCKLTSRTLLTHLLDRKRRTGDVFPLPAEIIDEITTHLDLLDAWKARGINRTFNVSCLRHINQCLTPSIKFDLCWFEHATDYRLPTTRLSDAKFILEPNQFVLLQWMVDLPFTPFETNPRPWTSSKVTIDFTFNRSVEAAEAMMRRPRKVWLRPRSRWPGDIFADTPDPKHVLAMWFDPQDGRVVEGVINKPIKTVKCVVLQDCELKVMIRLADIIRLVQYTLKYETSRDFIPLEFTFAVDSKCFWKK
jgi:hypothetical protein